MELQKNRSPALIVLALYLTLSQALAAEGATPPSPAAPDDLETVDINGRIARDEKPYRNLLRALTVVEENRVMAPGAVVRFKVLPWHDEATMRGLTLTLRSKSSRGADLATGIKPPAFWAIAAVRDPCTVSTIVYGWSADEPVFSVTLVSGSRRVTLPAESVYGFRASPVMWSHMDWWDHLRDRNYWVPIWDTSWPDDALVVLEPMREVPVAAETKTP